MKHRSQECSASSSSLQLANLFRLLSIILLGVMFVFSGAYAADPASVPKKKQTSLAKYFTPDEAYEHMQRHGSKSLFLDVRDPVEVNFTGMPTVADANVPLKFSDTSKWNVKKKQFEMKFNKSFIDDVAARAKQKGLEKTDTIILMCRSGVRSAKAANKLADVGYTNVYNLIEGFEGDAIEKGADKGKRTINGWKNSSLPWSPPKSLDSNKMYGNPALVKPAKK